MDEADIGIDLPDPPSQIEETGLERKDQYTVAEFRRYCIRMKLTM